MKNKMTTAEMIGLVDIQRVGRVELPPADSPAAKLLYRENGEPRYALITAFLWLPKKLKLVETSEAFVHWGTARTQRKSWTRYSKKYHRDHGPAVWHDPAWMVSVGDSRVVASIANRRQGDLLQWAIPTEVVVASATAADLAGRSHFGRDRMMMPGESEYLEEMSRWLISKSDHGCRIIGEEQQ